MRSVLTIGIHRGGTQSNLSLAASPLLFTATLVASRRSSGSVGTEGTCSKRFLVMFEPGPGHGLAAAGAPHLRISVCVICVSAYWTGM